MYIYIFNWHLVKKLISSWFLKLMIALVMRHRGPVEGKLSVVFLIGKLIAASHLSSTILDLHSEVPHSVNPLFREPKTLYSVY